ncbi:tyrosine-protein kinase transmembrane receptor Ror-like [Tigriopus californicus]|uniref:tyrosine-protein kinase transmembrane receptor Ror-like n=1 Tax=Tigriopus californicus TaxID=6832 RepID=UPI0027DA3C0C|nr:tyrosine-protein kinase transmembrane receptor Ror-like [Tigriopus californicus]
MAMSELRPDLVPFNTIPLDVIGCGCQDAKNCSCPSDGGGCRNGFCFCPSSGRLEFEDRRCHPAFQNSEGIGLSNKCPIPCSCGCRSSEICGLDGRCYCPDGTLVVPLVNGTDHLVGHNQTCPKIISTTDQVPSVISSQEDQAAISIQTEILSIFAFGFLVLFLTSIIVYFLRRQDHRRKRQFHSCHRNNQSLMMDGSPMAMAMTSNELYESGRLLSPETLSLFGSKLIEQDRLQLQEQVGQGNFGTVHRGLLSSSNGSTSTEVAIKIPRISAKQTSSLKDFYLEAQIATTFDHENILSCLGISANPNEAPWLVFEYMPFGDLAEVLRSNSGVPSLQRQDLPILEMSDLWWLSLQVAQGMKYLGDLRYTHRDLAARNCLLGRDLRLKISDFGLTRDIYTNEYYQMGEHRLLPIRWMSPESIQFGKFSPESDIWSYGVVLWEIFSFGKRPYFSYSNQEVAELLPQCKIHLTPPESCPDLLKSIMLSCLELEAQDRIRFPEIIEKLEVRQFFCHTNPSYVETKFTPHPTAAEPFSHNDLEFGETRE